MVPAAVLSDPIVFARFWAKVEKTATCWLWMGAKETRGYGYFRPHSHDPFKAHRIAYETLVQPVPEGLELDHLCRVRSCVNPAHLEVVTHAENVRRANRIRWDAYRLSRRRLTRPEQMQLHLGS